MLTLLPQDDTIAVVGPRLALRLGQDALLLAATMQVLWRQALSGDVPWPCWTIAFA